jgi:hypothetical protein
MNRLIRLFTKSSSESNLKALPAPQTRADKLRHIEQEQGLKFPIQARYHNFCRTQEFENPELDEPGATTHLIAREDGFNHKWRIFEVTCKPNIHDPDEDLITQKPIHAGEPLECAEMLWRLHDFETSQHTLGRPLSKDSPAPDMMGEQGIEYYRTFAHYEGIGFDVDGIPLPADADGRFNGNIRINRSEQDNVRKYSQLIPAMAHKNPQDARDLQPSAFLKELFAQYAGQPTVLSTERMVDQLQNKFARLHDIEEQINALETEKDKVKSVEIYYEQVSDSFSLIQEVLNQTNAASTEPDKAVIFDTSTPKEKMVEAYLYKIQPTESTIVSDNTYFYESSRLHQNHRSTMLQDDQSRRSRLSWDEHAIVTHDTINKSFQLLFKRGRGHHNRHLITPDNSISREEYNTVFVTHYTEQEQNVDVSLYHKNFIGAGWVEQTANYIESILEDKTVQNYSSPDLQQRIHHGIQDIRMFAAIQHAKLIYHSNKIQTNAKDEQIFQTNAFKEAIKLVEQALKAQIDPRDNFEIRMEAVRQSIYSPATLSIPEPIQDFLDYAGTKMTDDVAAELRPYRKEISNRKRETTKLLKREKRPVAPNLPTTQP